MKLITKDKYVSYFSIGGAHYKRDTNGNWFSENLWHPDEWESCYDQYLLEDRYKLLLREEKLKRILKG